MSHIEVLMGIVLMPHIEILMGIATSRGTDGN